MADSQLTPAIGGEALDRQLRLAYAVFDTDRGPLQADREGETRQVTILHTSYGRGLVEPAEDRACPT